MRENVVKENFTGIEIDDQFFQSGTFINQLTSKSQQQEQHIQILSTNSDMQIYLKIESIKVSLIKVRTFSSMELI